MKDTCDVFVKPQSMVIPKLWMGQLCIHTRQHVGCCCHWSVIILLIYRTLFSFFSHSNGTTPSSNDKLNTLGSALGGIPSYLAIVALPLVLYVLLWHCNWHCPCYCGTATGTVYATVAPPLLLSMLLWHCHWYCLCYCGTATGTVCATVALSLARFNYSLQIKAPKVYFHSQISHQSECLGTLYCQLDCLPS